LQDSGDQFHPYHWVCFLVWGIQAADELAQVFARQGKSDQVIDRKSFNNQFRRLEEEQIPISILNSENVARWLGLKLGATIVLVGTAKGIPNSNAVELPARFLNSRDDKKIGPSAEVNLTPSESLPDLSPNRASTTSAST
jgi:hypothetical protein